MNINLTMAQINKVNNTIKQWHMSSFSRISPLTIRKAQTNLLFDNMTITQETQQQAILETLDIDCSIGDRINL